MTTVPRKLYDLNKTIATAWLDTTRQVVGALAGGATDAVAAARTAGATVVGQGRSAVGRTMTTARSGAREVVGQARAQGSLGADRVGQAAERAVDRATAAVDPSPSSGTPYEQWTKGDLYERAQELDIEGRSAMSKRELIAALRR